MKRVIALAAAASALSGLSAVSSAAFAQPTEDQRIRAAMVLNFARFTQWPEARFAAPTAPVALCVDPRSSLAPALAALDGEDVGSRKLSVRQLPAARFTSACHVAFFDTNAAGELGRLNESGVLTVGAAPGFAKAGAIGFVEIGRQVRFEINNNAARAGDVRLSSRLLRLAVSVE